MFAVACVERRSRPRRRDHGQAGGHRLQDLVLHPGARPHRDHRHRGGRQLRGHRGNVTDDRHVRAPQTAHRSRRSRADEAQGCAGHGRAHAWKDVVGEPARRIDVREVAEVSGEQYPAGDPCDRDASRRRQRDAIRDDADRPTAERIALRLGDDETGGRAGDQLPLVDPQAPRLDAGHRTEPPPIGGRAPPEIRRQRIHEIDHRRRTAGWREIRGGAHELQVHHVRPQRPHQGVHARLGAARVVQQHLERTAVTEQRSRQAGNRGDAPERHDLDAHAEGGHLGTRRGRRRLPAQRRQRDVVALRQHAEVVIRPHLIAAPRRRRKAGRHRQDPHPSSQRLVLAACRQTPAVRPRRYRHCAIRCGTARSPR